MNRTFLAVIIVAVVALIIGGLFAVLYFSSYNNIVALEAATDEKWAQVEQELQRRYDLIPNVVNSAKLYIEYEGSVLENITRLRSQWAAASQTGDVASINPAHRLKGSAHFSSKIWLAWLRCLIHIRVDRTPGSKWMRLGDRSSPITIGKLLKSSSFFRVSKNNFKVEWMT